MSIPADSSLSDESRCLLEESARNVLIGIGEEPEREGLVQTPVRFARSLEFLTSGYRANAQELVRGALFDADGQDEMVIVKDIEVYSLCEHHLLPFHGRCHVGYLPNGKIIGLSKIPRIVEVFARRLQVQERLTAQIARCLQDELQPRGVGVVLDAVHLCMAMRGVQKQSSHAVTSAMLGVFRSDRASRQEFMALIKG